MQLSDSNSSLEKGEVIVIELMTNMLVGTFIQGSGLVDIQKTPYGENTVKKMMGNKALQ